MRGFSTVEDWCLSGMTQEDFIITQPFVRAESFDEEEEIDEQSDEESLNEIGEEIDEEINRFGEGEESEGDEEETEEF